MPLIFITTHLQSPNESQLLFFDKAEAAAVSASYAYCHCYTRVAEMSDTALYFSWHMAMRELYLAKSRRGPAGWRVVAPPFADALT